MNDTNWTILIVGATILIVGALAPAASGRARATSCVLPERKETYCLQSSFAESGSFHTRLFRGKWCMNDTDYRARWLLQLSDVCEAHLVCVHIYKSSQILARTHTQMWTSACEFVTWSHTQTLSTFPHVVMKSHSDAHAPQTDSDHALCHELTRRLRSSADSVHIHTHTYTHRHTHTYTHTHTHTHTTANTHTYAHTNTNTCTITTTK